MPRVDKKLSRESVLVLGAYGLIGFHIAKTLEQAGFKVIGLGRNRSTANRVYPSLNWRIHDLRDLNEAAHWQPVLEGVDLVVNAAGALQQSGDDNLDVVHRGMLESLLPVLAQRGIGLVQISAVGAELNADTAFMRTKAEGDQLVREAEIDHWIFKPGLVLAPTAYGGSALLRLNAAVPIVQPLALPETKIQTVHVDDIAGAVLMVAQGKVDTGIECDLVEETEHSLENVVGEIRNWLGFNPARFRFVLPRWALSSISFVADSLGHLGWRSPLRSSAVKVLETGISGDASHWRKWHDAPLSSLSKTLEAIPARAEDRLSARMALLMPLVIAALAVFWFLSGIIGVISLDEAARVLTNVGWSSALAKFSVVFWAVVDVALAVGILYRPTAKLACLCMIGVSLFYLAASTVAVPTLWLDPLGPLVKVLPGILLALVARVMLETR